jgi:hypothetical protein
MPEPNGKTIGTRFSSANIGPRPSVVSSRLSKTRKWTKIKCSICCSIVAKEEPDEDQA